MPSEPARLRNDDTFPTLTADTLDGDPITLPDDVEGVWSVLLFYRGHW